MERTDIEFSSDGVTCAAWLYRPDRDGPVPLVVMAHGFSATRDLRLDAFAERFCFAGLGVLLFDYRYFGASGGEPRQLLDVPSQQADYHAALAHARQLDWVDSERIAIFGSSFSGGHVIAVAAQDQRVAAVVAQCPFTDGIATLFKLPPLNLAKLSAAGLADEIGARRGREPRYVPAAGLPGEFGVMTTPDSLPGFDAMRSPESRWENRVAARIALRIPTYRPGRQAASVSCPALFCVCDRDALTPPKPTVRLVSKAPRGEIKRYPFGHFDVYFGGPFDQVVADQTEFLLRHLDSGAPGRAGA